MQMHRGKDQNVLLGFYKGISEIFYITIKIQNISKASGNRKELKYPKIDLECPFPYILYKYPNEVIHSLEFNILNPQILGKVLVSVSMVNY